MIAAHGPIGYLIVQATKRLWKDYAFSRRQWGWLLVIGYVGGIFPDIDLFYTKFFDASASHRHLITHTFLPYIVLFAIVGGVAWWRKQRLLFVATTLFMFGAFSHIIADSFFGTTLLLYPFSTTLHGVAQLNIEWLNQNLLFYNFLLEGLFCAAFFYGIIMSATRTTLQRRIWTGVLLVVFATGVTTITVGNQYIYHMPVGTYFSDTDRDGIVNIEDRDMDGDGQLNINDLDADGDNKSNVQEIIEHSESYFGVLIDSTDARLSQMPVRLGLLSNNDLIRSVFMSAGIFLPQELQQDYTLQPEGYAEPPTAPHFDRNNQNYYAWLEHNNKLETGDALQQGRNQIGDILFFNSGLVGIVSGVDNSSEVQVLSAANGRTIEEVPLSEITLQEGAPIARGKLLDSRPLFVEQEVE